MAILKDERGVVVDDACYFNGIMSQWSSSLGVSSIIVSMGIAFAFAVVRRPSIGLHCVAWSAHAKLFPVFRLLDKMSPSRTERRRLATLCTVIATAAPSRILCQIPPKILAKMVDPIIVIKWLRLSRLVRHYKKVGQCVDLAAEILSPGCGMTLDQLKASYKKVSSEAIRQGRVRLDIVCMLLHRLWIASLIASGVTIHIFLYIDGSPTWRGIEQFCASYELWDGERWHRRLFPVVALDHSRMSAFGKCVTLLWQI